MNQKIYQLPLNFEQVLTLAKQLSVADQIQLNQELEKEISKYSTSNSLIKGVRGKTLLPFAGKIPSEDLLIMSRKIQEGCEQVDLNEW